MTNRQSHTKVCDWCEKLMPAHETCLMTSKPGKLSCGDNVTLFQTLHRAL